MVEQRESSQKQTKGEAWISRETYNVHQQNCVLSVEREREPVLFNQIAFQK